MSDPSDDPPLELSIVVPMHNEEENVVGLVDDIEGALAGQLAFELVVLDDGSSDGTLGLLKDQMRARSWPLRVLRMSGRKPGVDGKGAAYAAGFRAARAPLVATLDGDRQNDPRDLVAMIEALRAQDLDMVQGNRRASRQDNLLRKFSSWIGYSFRRVLLGDTIRDTACGIRVFRREAALTIPVWLRGVHRFMGYYLRFSGHTVEEFPVRHLPRAAGRAKYGIWNRALPGLRDLFAMRWMRSRWGSTHTTPVEASP